MEVEHVLGDKKVFLISLITLVIRASCFVSHFFSDRVNNKVNNHKQWLELPY